MIVHLEDNAYVSRLETYVGFWNVSIPTQVAFRVYREFHAKKLVLASGEAEEGGQEL